MDSELQSKTIRAGIWSFAEAVGLRGVQFLIGIVLARILMPEQFGLIGMLAIFIAIAKSFLDSGFGAALIQRQEITEKDTCSIFYFNIVVGILAAGCLCWIAPRVSAFYGQPILVPILDALSLVLVINAFGLVQETLLMKTLDFKTQTKVSLIASVLSGGLGIALAYRGLGVWSLVAQQLSAAVFRTVLFWIFSRWRPAWVFSFRSLKEMFGFGSKMLASGLLNTLFDNIYYIVIGKLFSPASLGYFTRADSIQQLPSITLTGVVGRVTFPVFSKIQHDRERMKRGMKKSLSLLVLFNFPLMIGLAVVARPLVLVLLTEKWAPCIPYLQLLSLVGLMFPLNVMNLTVLQALGRSDLFLRLEIIKKALIVANIAITWRWGIMAMIAGQVVTSVASYYLNAYYNRALLNYSVWEQIGDMYPYLLNTSLMGAAVYAMQHLPIASPAILLVCQVAVGICLYMFLCRIFRNAAYMNIQEMLFRRLPFQAIP